MKGEALRVLKSKEKNQIDKLEELVGSLRQVNVIKNKQLELYYLLVEELVKDSPDLKLVRSYCQRLKIPFKLDSITQLTTVFNQLQSLNSQVMTGP